MSNKVAYNNGGNTMKIDEYGEKLITQTTQERDKTRSFFIQTYLTSLG